MKKRTLSERGQALIIVAFGAIALFAIAGLAIDGSHKYSDRRHAQNAADTAVLAAAYAKAEAVRLGHDPSTTWAEMSTAALNRAGENGYSNDLVDSVVEVYNPPMSGIYNQSNDVRFDPNDYVQVIITSNRPTWFMRVLGINSFTNVVQAWAYTRAGNDHFNFGGNAVVALSPEGCALRAAGTTLATVNGGGMYSNSSDSCAFQKTSCSGSIVVKNTSGTTGTITMVGGAHLNSSCWNTANAALSAGGIKQYDFPPTWQELAPPTACSQPLVNISGNPSSVTLSPGHYASMPPKSNMKDVTLQPGVYCIDSGIQIGSTDTYKISPGTQGVFLYIQPGGGFAVNGQATINLWGINQANVDADASLAPYKGYLIYAAPNYALDPSSLPQCKINGGSTSTYTGTIYAPYCDITLNGGSGMTMNSQVIGYTVDMSGASGVTINYNAGSTPLLNIPLQVGLAK